MTIKETVTLYFREGSSDKFYNANIEETDGEFKLTFVYGRTGTSGQSGIKCSNTNYDTVKKEYDKLVKEKMAKGYKPDANAVSYAGISNKTDSGLRPHLLKPIDEEILEKYITDDEYGAQEKYDGHRKMLQRNGQSVISINRKGEVVGFPVELETSCLELSLQRFTVDGEEIGNRFYAYDIVEKDGEDLKSLPYLERYGLLSVIFASDNKHIQVAPVYLETEMKRKLYNDLQKEKKEGIVFKKLDSLYASSMRNNDQVKFKFWASASCIVLKVNNKRSVLLGLMDNGKQIEIGNCTISVNHEIPEPGDIVEIRYLYAYQNGSLYQPTYLGKRTDITINDCSISQLKYKAEIEE